MISGDSNDLKFIQIFLKLDRACVMIPGSLISSIDLLFKTFWAFNICYANQLVNFMYFFEIIFEMNKEKKSSVIELFNIILRD
jgi:hypothetical protein